MSQEILIGLCALLGIVGLQVFLSQRTQIRVYRAWNRAQSALQARRWPEAAAALRECIELAPLWVHARIALGAVLAEQDQLNEAEEQLRFAADLQPRQPEGHAALGLFYATRLPQRAEDAIDALGKALEHGPGLRASFSADPRLAALREHPRFGALLSRPPSTAT